MNAHQLILQLAERDVQLSAQGGELSVRATKGALTEDLKRELLRLKSEILALLHASRADEGAAEEAAPRLTPQPQARLAPFPFADLQVAFYMANDPYLQFHVRPHYYCEYDMAALDLARYEQAVNQALQRHRGEMVMVTEDQMLRALPELPRLSLKVVDLRDLPEAQAQGVLQDTRARMSREELPLTRWPWFDLHVSRWTQAGQARFRVHWNLNNFYSDGFGLTVLQADIARYYRDPEAALPPLSLSFRDAVMGLEALAASPEGARAEAYWRDRLATLPGPPELPMTSLNRRCRSRLQRREGFLPAQTWQNFKALAGQHGLTPTGAIVCAYAHVLSAWSGSEHFTLSNMVTRRLPLHPEMMSLVGNFASLYPLEVDLRGPQSFAAKAVRLQQQMMRDSANRAWGGMQVMQALNRLKGELGGIPCPFVVGSGLFMEKYHKADFACLETAQTALDHQFWELDDGRYFYVWDLLEAFFPPGMVDAMWQAFAQLLARLSAGEDAWRQAHLDLGPSGDALFGTTSSPAHIPDGLLHDGLRLNAERQPLCVAVRTGDRQLSYAELDTWSDAVARALQAHGVQAGDRVAVIMDRGPAIAAASHGVLRAGAAYVPIDPSLPADRLGYMLGNCQARLVLTDRSGPQVASWPADVARIDVRRVLAQGRPDGPGLHPSVLPSVQAVIQGPQDLAYLIYTSGSTGRPKGVMIDHRGALNTVTDINERFAIGADDVIFGVSSFSFDLSVYDLFGALSAGATLVYPEPEMALNPSHWLQLMARQGATVWNSAPPLMKLLLETAERQQVQLPELRLVMLSGDWIPVDMPDAVRRLAPQAKVVSLGGATEASIWSIYHVVEAQAHDASRPPASRIPYGRPLRGQAWHVRDAALRPTPVWTPGDLYISGVGLAQGYWGDEAKTRASFIHDPLTGQTLYKTGDRGRYLPDGNIDFLGRLDNQVKISGHRIELGEIEAVLMAQPAVKEAVVLARPASDGGERTLVASICLRPTAAGAPSGGQGGEQALIETLRQALLRQLPSYMVPSAWAVLSTMPLNANGKTDRQALARAHYGLGGQGRAPTAHVAPRDALERALAPIWCAVLKQAQGSVHEDFFDLGGQSIDAVRFVARVQEQLGMTLSLGDMWSCRTLARLAEHLGQAGKARPQGNLVRLGPDRPGRPCFMVHPAGGHCIGYAALVARLPQPCWGLVVQPQDLADAHLQSLAVMASRYVAQLRQVQPQGPYELVGWSSGGCIAFEMARQLEQAGEQVLRVALIDCPAPRLHAPASAFTKLRWFFEDLNQGLPVAQLNDALLASWPEAQRFEQAVALMNHSAQGALEATALAPIFGVFQAIVDAVLRYHPEPVQAELLVLRATEGRVSEFAGHPDTASPDWGWGAFSRGAVHSAPVAGSHHTVLRHPGVETIASRWLAARGASQPPQQPMPTDPAMNTHRDAAGMPSL